MVWKLPQSWLYSAAAAVFVFFQPLCAGAQLRTPPPDTSRYEIGKIRFTGNDAVKSGELALHIESEATKCRSLLFLPACWVVRSPIVEQRRYLDSLELERDAIRVRVEYYLRGFRSATAAPVVQRDDNRLAEVTFVINEGDPLLITSLEVAGAATIIPPRLQEQIVPIRAGQPLNLLSLDSTVARLRDALWNAGYAAATVGVDTARSSGGMDVRINVDTGRLTRVERIQVTNNRKIGAETIRNSLYLQEGDLFRLSEVIRSQRALYESRLFRRAQIESAPLTDSTRILLVDVREAALREARLGGGFSTVDFFQVEGQFTNYNWNGGARRVSLSLEVGNLLAKQLNGQGIFRDALDGLEQDAATYLSPTWRASAELKIPWYMSPRNDVSLNAFFQRRSLPGIFVDRSYGFNGVFTREVSERLPLSFGYQFEVTRVDAGDLYFCANYGLCDPPTVDALRSSARLSPISLSTTIDRTDDPFNASRGYSISLRSEHASSYTLSDYRYNRLEAEAARFFPVLDNSVVALHAHAGWVKPLGSTDQALGLSASTGSVLHPRKRFYAGGSQSVRGFGEGQLGPRILTIPNEPLIEAGCTISDELAYCAQEILNDRDLLLDSSFTARPLGGNLLLEGSVEVRFPLFGSLGGALFVDGALVGESGLSDLKQSTLAVTPGFGFRYASAAGPIRIDFGYNPFLVEDLPVVTEVESEGRRQILELQMLRPGGVDLVPARRTFSPRRFGGLLGFLSQFTLHLSIGQAF